MAGQIAAREPKNVTLKAGRSYAWCACGLSEIQPFCDGAHKSTDMKPLLFRQEETEEVWLCQCKHTGNQPRCDGSHNNL